ncbi:MAG: hypothetical protein AB7G62_01215 [Magnetospirillum sp.]
MSISGHMQAMFAASFTASSATKLPLPPVPVSADQRRAALQSAIIEARRKHAPLLIGTSLKPFDASDADRFDVAVDPDFGLVGKPRRQRGPSRRKVQKYRSAHALKRWPWKLATQFGWTDAEVCLIDALMFLGGDSGEFDAYRSELENRAGVSPSTQRAVEAKLRDLGMLVVIENRRGYARNEANTYRLEGVLKEAARILWLRRGEGTKSKHPSGCIENLYPHTSSTLSAPRFEKRTPGWRPPVSPEVKALNEFFDAGATGEPTSPQSGEVCMLLGRDEHAKPAEVKPAGDGIAEPLALDLIKTFLPDVAATEAPPETTEDALALADRLQRTYAPTLWPHVWRAWRKRWGLTAALAVLETALMRRGGLIRESGGQYLSGILGRNRRQAPAPEATLQAMRASRRAPGLAHGRGGRGRRS